jgi:hypothetical protein
MKHTLTTFHPRTGEALNWVLTDDREANEYIHAPDYTGGEPCYFLLCNDHYMGFIFRYGKDGGPVYAGRWEAKRPGGSTVGVYPQWGDAMRGVVARFHSMLITNPLSTWPT